MQEFGQSDLTIIFQNIIARLWQIHASLHILKAQTRELDQNLVKFMGSLKGKIWP